MRLIGSEQVNGKPTWHIKGTNATTSEAIDLYIRQSDYLPAKMVTQPTGDATLGVTVVVTSVNTGASIDLPVV